MGAHVLDAAPSWDAAKLQVVAENMSGKGLQFGALMGANKFRKGVQRLRRAGGRGAEGGAGGGGKMLGGSGGTRRQSVLGGEARMVHEVLLAFR